MTDKINVLDHGYVRLINVMGDDLSVVNAARASYDKESEELTDKDKRLIKFLAENEHFSVFRHQTLTYECYAPLMVCRQWFKYAVASSHLESQQGWNESSRRYITEEPVFYIPEENEWRSKPENNKQGSGDPVDNMLGRIFTEKLNFIIEKGELFYEQAIAEGIAPEQARLFLPAYGLYVRWRWTASLQSVSHFLNQRLAHDSQVEIQKYAQAVYKLTKNKFPVSLEHLIEIN